MHAQADGPLAGGARGDLYLLFSLGHDRYALAVHDIIEVLPLRRLKAMPESPSWVSGVFERRGELVPVLDLAARVLGRPAQALASTRLVLVHYRPAQRTLGLLLEQATDTQRLAAEAFRDSGLDSGAAPYLGPAQGTGRSLVQRIEVTGLLPDDVCAQLFPVPGVPA